MTAADQRAERQGLLNRIAFQLELRHPVPCVTAGDESVWWTSEDPLQQRAAADRCIDCAVFVACRRYGDTYKREAGVYGGRVERERMPERRRKAAKR